MTERGSHHEQPQNQPDPITIWLLDRMKEAKITVTDIPIKQVRGWKIGKTEIGNYDKQGNPKYFRILGERISNSGREVDSFDQFGIAEVPDASDPDKAVGTVGLLVDEKTGDILITAAAEPFQAESGEKPGDFISLRASVQGSYTNIQENKVNYSSKINLSEYTNLISINSGRIRGKVRFGYTKIDKESLDISKDTNSHWFSREEIDKAIADGKAPFNSAFHIAYSVLKAKEKYELAA